MDEAFLSSSNKEVVPVVKIDSITISGGEIGVNCRKMMDIFHSYTSQYGTGQG